MNKFSFEKYFKKPAIHYLWSVFAAFGVIIGVFIPLKDWIYPDRAAPYYLVVSDELAISSPASRIKIYYDSTEVSNIKIMQIALWNGGSCLLYTSRCV